MRRTPPSSIRRLAGLAALTLIFTACGQPGAPPAEPQASAATATRAQIDSTGAQIDSQRTQIDSQRTQIDSPQTQIDSMQVIDLTHPLSPDSLYWPSGSPFEYERVSWGLNASGDWYAAGSFATAEHLGTHLDAPIHFAPEVWSNAEIPAEHFIGAAAVIDISARAASDPDTTLTVADIEAWEAAHGAIPPGAIVIVRTDWSARWPDWNDYYGSDDPFDTTTMHFPGVSPEAATAIAERGASGVGIDTASIDPGNDLDFRAHRILATANLYNLENLTGLDQLPAAGATLLALPIKIAGSSGGPARVLALLPPQ